jgi:Icc-related predicted phosphoesterase
MRFMVISDIHGKMEMVQRVMLETPGIDCILAAGDITNFGGYAEAAKVMDPILASKIPVMAVAGNCDTEGVEEYLEDKKIHIGRTGLRLREFVFVGVGGSLPCPKITPHECSDNVLETLLCRVFSQTKGMSTSEQGSSLIVVSHQPAFDTQVDSVGGRNTGSPAVRKFIETHQPILAVSGHIHEAFGTDRIGRTTLINPGPLKDGRYAIVDINGQQVQVQLCRLGQVFP